MMARIRPESKMEVEEVSRASNCFDRVTQEQMSEDLETWTPHPVLRDLELSRIKPLMGDVALPGLTPKRSCKRGYSREIPKAPHQKGSHTPVENNR